MTLQLYNIWMQEGATISADDQMAAQVQNQGLLGRGDLIADKIATDQIDLGVEGQWRLGPILSEKLATELRSLAASDYDNIPFYEASGTDRNEGYYQIESATTNPAHKTVTDTWVYTVGLNEAGTHSSHWRAVRTNVQSITHDLASGSDYLIGVDDAATKTRWYVPSSGTEGATKQSTEEGEYGSVDLYDPTDTAFVNPILLYEIPYDEEWRTDVVVYDEMGRDRELSLNTGGTANQWIHVYHTRYEFIGNPIVDTGRLRVEFDEPNNQIIAETWDENNDEWSSVTIDHSNYDLFDADIEQIRPSDVRVFTEWEKAGGTIDQAVLSFQRGLESVVVRTTDNDTNVADDLEDLLRPIASGQSNDPTPDQDLIRRDKVK